MIQPQPRDMQGCPKVHRGYAGMHKGAQRVCRDAQRCTEGMQGCTKVHRGYAGMHKGAQRVCRDAQWCAEVACTGTWNRNSRGRNNRNNLRASDIRQRRNGINTGRE